MGKGGDCIYSLSFPPPPLCPPILPFFSTLHYSPFCRNHSPTVIVSRMGMPPQSVSNGLIYTTYAIFLYAFLSSFFFLFVGPRNRCGTDMVQTRIIGVALAWRFRGQSKLEFIHSNRTQTGLLIFLFPPSIFFFPLWIVEY